MKRRSLNTSLTLIKFLVISTIAVMLSSCLEELPVEPRSLIRVYGNEGTSLVDGVTKRSNGKLLLFGSERKPEFRDGSYFEVPFIIETDEFGNQLRQRNYGFLEGEFQSRLSVLDPSGVNEFETVWAAINKVLELSDGRIFCLGIFRFNSKNPSFVTPHPYYLVEDFYIILDANLDPVNWGFFDDSPQEGTPTYFHSVNNDNIYELPSGDVLMSSFFIEVDAGLALVDRGYSLHKLTLSTGNIEISRYFTGDPNQALQARGFVMSKDGSSVILVANEVPPGGSVGAGNLGSKVQTVLTQIDLSSGSIINFRKYITRGFSYQLTPADNGYVAQIYHPDPDDSLSTNRGKWWGSLLFVDENLDSLKLVRISEINNILLGNSVITKTQDGGFVTEFVQNSQYGYRAVLIRTDKDGNVLWRHEESDETQISDIIEMNDGGIVYTVIRDYNGIGIRTTLVKLTADGKL